MARPGCAGALVNADPMPAVLDALVELVAPGQDGTSGIRTATAPGLEGVQVFDGPPLGDLEIGDALALGTSMFMDLPAVATEHVGYGGRRTDSFLISGLLQSSTGEVNLAIPRGRAYELLAVFRALIAANLDLGGSCDWARMARHTYRAAQTSSGAIALIEFAIRVDATRFEGA